MKKISKKIKLNTKYLICLIAFFILVFSATTYIKTYSDLLIDFESDPDYVDSGVNGNKVHSQNQ